MLPAIKVHENSPVRKQSNTGLVSQTRLLSAELPELGSAWAIHSPTKRVLLLLR